MEATAVGPAPTARKARKGSSFFRTILIVGVVGLVLIVGGAISFFADQSSRRSPLEIEVYPGASYRGLVEQTSSSQTMYFLVPGVMPEQVAEFYQQEMREHYGDTGENCVRIPEIGQFPPEELQPDYAPYFYRCMFDRSGFNTSQWTLVTIMPGLPNENPANDTSGMVVLQHEQVWTP
ncbi:MAG: hypothetical protein SF123_00325 [Chloroflexota bacterium]|nr:hypothetical protein [Chloroflexota bacterium]